jgi:hypothetical protein
LMTPWMYMYRTCIRHVPGRHRLGMDWAVRVLQEHTAAENDDVFAARRFG